MPSGGKARPATQRARTRSASNFSANKAKGTFGGSLAALTAKKHNALPVKDQSLHVGKTSGAGQGHHNQNASEDEVDSSKEAPKIPSSFAALEYLPPPFGNTPDESPYREPTAVPGWGPGALMLFNRPVPPESQSVPPEMQSTS
eukprot:5392344-Amphidinium_carterae.1